MVPWAKLRRADEDEARREMRRASGPVSAWRSLVDHSADVAAVFDAAVRVSGTLARLENLADRALERDTELARLGVLAAMHDFGKANRGFQARRDLRAQLVGHVREAWIGLSDPRVLPRLADAIPLREAESWFGTGSIAMAVAHHGFPLNPTSQGRDDTALWAVANGDDPVASLAPLGAAIRLWFPAAFDPRPSRKVRDLIVNRQKPLRLFR
jgi:CRISPR-associated endonuclease/helicase Cas3